MTSTQPAGLCFPKLTRGRLIRRYKRFLADVELDSGEPVTAHCPNTGAMTACSTPGRPVYLSFHDNPKRKFKYSWELIDMPDSLVGVNTLIPNRLVYHGIKTGQVPFFSSYNEIKKEVKIDGGHRLDLMVSKDGKNPCYVEIKNCSLVENGVAAFPDAVTARGLSHLKALQKLKASGFSAVMFFLVNRMDAEIFRPADPIDPAYGKELRKARENGIDILVWDVAIDLRGIRLRREVPFQL